MQPSTKRRDNGVVTSFDEVLLDEHHSVLVGSLPTDLVLRDEAFNWLWEMHPLSHPIIRVRNWVGPARWKQAFGHDYAFSGQVLQASPVPAILEQMLRWAHDAIDGRLNGALVNWYDGTAGHYIGPHRDDVRQLVPGGPIVTISMGAPRTFRLRPARGQGFHDIKTASGQVIVMPWETNRRGKHEIVLDRRSGRRISITLRCFG